MESTLVQDDCKKFIKESEYTFSEMVERHLLQSAQATDWYLSDGYKELRRRALKNLIEAYKEQQDGIHI